MATRKKSTIILFHFFYILAGEKRIKKEVRYSFQRNLLREKGKIQSILKYATEISKAWKDVNVTPLNFSTTGFTGFESKPGILLPVIRFAMHIKIKWIRSIKTKLYIQDVIYNIFACKINIKFDMQKYCSRRNIYIIRNLILHQAK